MTNADAPAVSPSLAAIGRELLLAADRSAIVDILPHVRADGDAAGSALALWFVLTDLGMSARVWLEEPLDWTLGNLPGADQITVFTAEAALGANAADVAVMVDCGETSRLGSRAGLFTTAPVRMVLDHHLSSRDSEGLSHIDSRAAAVGEIVFSLIQWLEKEKKRPFMSPEIATCLMSAILTDTGGFRFSNTTRDTFEIAAELMKCGLDIGELSYGLLESMSLAKYRLIGLAHAHAHFHHNAQLAVLAITREMLSETGAAETDTNGLANMLRAVQSVCLAIVLKIDEDGIVRGNVRSKDGFNAAEFAGLFGGGGHARAAGFQLEGMDLKTAAARVTDVASAWMERTCR